MNPLAAAVSAETLALAKAALGGQPLDLNKTISTGTGLVAYDLQAPAKNLYPVFTPLRNKIPRVPGKGGVATNWRAITSIVGSGFNNSGWVPEGQRSGAMSYTTAPVAANYVTLGEEDAVTMEAVHAGKNFEDVRASMAVRLLQKTMLKEENGIIGGNGSLQLGTPPNAPTLTASGTGNTLPAITYSVIVVALTQEGYYNSTYPSTTSTVGVATTRTVNGADGQTYTINGGSSNKSAAATQAVSAGQQLKATVPTITGACAYAWFVGASGSETLQGITTVNSCIWTAPLVASQQPVSAITADCSANPGLAFDGLITAALNPNNVAYVNTLATGATLTASGRGSVVEIDNMLAAMWNNYQLSPSVMYCNAQEIKTITDLVMSSAQGSLVRYNIDAANTNQPYGVVAGGVVNTYFNPYMPNGGAMIPVRIHPKCPPGTIFAWAEELPAYYQNNEVQNVAEIKTRQDYYQIDWPQRTRKWESGVYAEEVLAIYATFAIAIINNIPHN